MNVEDKIVADLKSSFAKGLSDMQSISEWPRLAHQLTLAMGLLVASQILYSISIDVLNVVDVFDLLPLLGIFLGQYALLLVQPQLQQKVHSMIWLLVTPFLIQKIQQQLIDTSSPKRQNLWILVGLVGASFQLLLMSTDQPILRWLALALFIALQVLEVLQIKDSEFQLSDKAVVILFLSFWFLYFWNQNAGVEVLWTLTDINLPFLLQTISYLIPT